MVDNKELNQINNVGLIRDVIDQAISFLISQNKLDPNDSKVFNYQFGYIYTRKDGFVEALFKIEAGNEKIFYMALQEKKLLLLNIPEEVYNATVDGMKNEHECLKKLNSENDSNQNSNVTSRKNTLIGVIGFFLIIALIVGGIILINKNVKLIDKSFKQLSFKIPDNYKEHVPLNLFNSSSIDYDNKKCQISLKYSTKFQTYNFNTASYEENNYTADELYEGITLEEKTINGKTWYYHNNGNDNYIYDYIDKNVNYKMSISSIDDDYCKVNDIVSSLIIK